MPIFGYNIIGANSLGLSDTDLFVNADPGRVAIRGNPVPGGNLVSAHVYLTPPLAGPNSLLQIGIYDATGGVPALYPHIATSMGTFINPGGPAGWYVMPIVGVLTPGSSYVAAVLSNNNDPANVSVKNDTIPNEDCLRTFIAPGVFPNPLGAATFATREWSLYITYLLPSDDVSQQVAAWSCDCGNDS